MEKGGPSVTRCTGNGLRNRTTERYRTCPGASQEPCKQSADDCIGHYKRLACILHRERATIMRTAGIEPTRKLIKLTVLPWNSVIQPTFIQRWQNTMQT